MYYKCPKCGKRLSIFNKEIEGNTIEEEWRCSRCRKELFLIFDRQNKINKLESFWTDYYGNKRTCLTEIEEDRYIDAK